uniref:FCP1 homology domain-containing protein n=1 Tax=viral metagenome TaxID=1070528 RepID=A0A6C0FB43_9ZZZZ|tara:strand:- start:7021 stop:7632 length:612 start_codon:yes stop_codon:yes gene_type:complete
MCKPILINKKTQLRKPIRIAVDFDEVLCPMLKPLSQHFSKKYRCKIPSNDPSLYNYANYFNISSEESKLLVQSYYNSDECKNAKPLIGSEEAIRKMNEKYSLGIITGRQIYGKDATHLFLNTYFPDIFEYIEFTNSYSLYGPEIAKSDICQKYDVDFLIDDSVSICNEVSDIGVTPLLFGNYEWNKEDNLERIISWEEFDKYL